MSALLEVRNLEAFYGKTQALHGVNVSGWNYRAFGRERSGQEHLATGDIRNDRLAWRNPV